MVARLILAHDLGTTGNKASLYNHEGKRLASAFYGYRTELPRVNWVEQNPTDWWQAVCVSTRQLLCEARVQPEDIACVAFSGQMMGAVAVDRRARPLRNALIWADMRAGAEAQRIIDGVGWERAYQITGHRASSSYSGAKILWVRDHEPEIFAQAHKFLQAKDFVVARLTGVFATEPTDASGTNLFDLRAGEWSAEILDAIGLDSVFLPELHASTEVIGGVTRDAAQETGLAPGTPVVIGGGDGMCAAIGAGVVTEGSAYNYVGSSAWIGLVSRQPIYDPQMRTFTWAHMVPGLFHPNGTMQAAGNSYQWARDTLCLPEVDAAERLGLSPYELMNLQAESSPPGANGLLFLPYLLGERSPRWNPKARGAYIGLTMKHSRADILRATLEGITLNLRVILEAFKEQGAGIDAMRVIGGGAKGRTWRQIMADIYGVPVLRPALLDEATSLGAAVAGGVGVGIFPDFSIAEQLTPPIERAEPNLALRPLYDRMYTIFNQAYEQLAPVYDTLAEL